MYDVALPVCFSVGLTSILQRVANQNEGGRTGARTHPTESETQGGSCVHIDGGAEGDLRTQASREQ